MKKLLVLTCLMMLGLSAVYAETPATAAVDNNAVNKNINMQKYAERIQRHKAMEEKLGLTDAQKEKARESRLKGVEKLKPLYKEISVKKEEIQAVKKSRMAVQAQEERITELEYEIDVLNAEIKKIHKQNLKDFESILTKKQRKILKKMREDAIKKHEASMLKK